MSDIPKFLETVAWYCEDEAAEAPQNDTRPQRSELRSETERDSDSRRVGKTSKASRGAVSSQAQVCTYEAKRDRYDQYDVTRHKYKAANSHEAAATVVKIESQAAQASDAATRGLLAIEKV